MKPLQEIGSEVRVWPSTSVALSNSMKHGCPFAFDWAGIAETTYYRWRKRHDPAQVDADRRCRELESEVGRLKRLVAELMLDKQMLQDLAKKKW